MKNYFDALDRLCESGQPSKSEAISALQGKFPELSANAERRKDSCAARRVRQQ